MYNFINSLSIRFQKFTDAVNHNCRVIDVFNVYDVADCVGIDFLVTKVTTGATWRLRVRKESASARPIVGGIEGDIEYFPSIQSWLESFRLLSPTTQGIIRYLVNTIDDHEAVLPTPERIAQVYAERWYLGEERPQVEEIA